MEVINPFSDGFLMIRIDDMGVIIEYGCNSEIFNYFCCYVST